MTPPDEQRASLSEAALSATHGRAESSLLQVVQQVERLASTSARFKVTLDAASTRQRSAVSRATDARSTLTRLNDALARLNVLGLNAGLEGARIDGIAGKALLMVADELRSLTARAAGAIADIGGTLDELSAELVQLEGQLGEARGSAAQLSDASTTAMGAAHETQRSMGALGDLLATQTGLDAETAAAIARAEEQTLALRRSLQALTERSAQGGSGALDQALSLLRAQLSLLLTPPER